jgi:hypothetical protein
MKKRADQKLKNYLTLFKVPIAPDSLDPNIFYFPEQGGTPRLHDSIYAQITRDIEFFCGEQPQRISKYYLVGDALIPGNKDRTKDLIVLILLNKNLMDLDVDGLLAEEILKLSNAISGKYVLGTSRLLMYRTTLREDSIEKYQGVYDLFTQQWVKLPSGLKV